MNLGELQSYVWAQTDTTDVDLNASTIAGYLDEAFIRTIAAENRWSFYEQGWQLTQEPGNAWIDMPIDMNPPAIMSIVSLAGGMKLEQINQEEAEDRFTTNESAGTPCYYSLWANRIWLWPLSVSDMPVTYVVRGYRKPLTTFNSSTGQVDADPRLHRALAHYAIALAYAQQEDDVLEARYMDRWQRDVEMVRQAVMDPAGNRPLVMYGNFAARRGAFSTVGAAGRTAVSSAVIYPPGPAGPMGPPGPAGATGATGATGPVETIQTIETQSGTTYTVVAADAGKLIRLTATATVTLPSAGLSTGQRADFVSIGGVTTFSLGGGATWDVAPTPSAVTRAVGSFVSAIKMGATTWALVGDLA